MAGRFVRLRSTIVLLCLLLTIVCLPQTRWLLLGVVKNESFYHLKPTSYWSHLIRSITICWATDPDGELRAYYLYCDDPLASVKQLVGVCPSYRQLTEAELPFSTADETAIPVLVRLTTDHDWKVRWFAVLRLGQLGTLGRTAEQWLRKATMDSNSDVASEAEVALERIGCPMQFRRPTDLSNWMK